MATATISGGLVPNITGANLRTVDTDIIVDLTDCVWNNPLTAGMRTDIVNGLNSNQDQAFTSWTYTIQSEMSGSEIVRVSDTRITIPVNNVVVEALGDYACTVDEVITVTIPASAIDEVSPVVGSPTFTIVNEAGPSMADGTKDDLIRQASLLNAANSNQDLMNYYLNNGGSGTAFHDAERSFLISKVTSGTGVGKTNQDLWMEYLNQLGYAGSYNDKRYQFWYDIVAAL